jgi:uncharacterized membrane protein YidH (DUF202 family)
MDNKEKFPLWVRIYARKKKKNLVEQLLAVLFGIIALIVLDYFLNSQEIAAVFNADNIIKYAIIFFVLVFHVLMVHAANNWVATNSSLKFQYQFLPKLISYVVAFLILVSFTLIKVYLLGGLDH